EPLNPFDRSLESLLHGGSHLKANLVLSVLSGVLFSFAIPAGAQTQSAPAPASPPAAPPTWSVGSLDFSGLIDGYYSYNANRPSNAANGQINDLYNFNDKTDQFNLSAAKFTVGYDPNPIGFRLDLLFGRAKTFLHSSDKGTDNYIEQAYISAKPPKWHGTEVDFGQFVTSAGAEVIEAKDDWNYSRSILFAWAIPYYHFGLRAAVPVTASWTAGVQVVNGWNNVVDNNGGATIGLTSALTRPKYAWALNYYTGPENTDTQKSYRNLIDTTVMLTPVSKFSAYINYDYGQNHSPAAIAGGVPVPEQSPHWQGVAFAAHGQIMSKSALAGRVEYFDDHQGFSTGSAQAVKEFTGTYEYKWLSGLLTRVEYRRDWSNVDFFHKGDGGMVDAQSTLTMAFIAFFSPKR
ncbi:MAG: porin, partial [Acidobacteriaceae bacterium]